ncbi:hypothetical protein TSUD_394010 [Trifolium subterraneum]|uniref:COMM domain-containing protein n=1 Tax=Trifolium subterraneum TaxID=3900 RepID=A0A2Z6NWV7_TRISU|nr:hypothetical protein TSUD_394010 [Trifolium subterraneum]
MLIRRCVYENTCKDDIPKLFSSEVLPELQKLLTLLLQKFWQKWQEEVLKDRSISIQNIVPRLKAMTWNMANRDTESSDRAAVIKLKLQNDAQFHSGELDVKFQFATNSLEMMLKAMHNMRDQFSTMRQTERLRFGGRKHEYARSLPRICSNFTFSRRAFAADEIHPIPFSRDHSTYRYHHEDDGVIPTNHHTDIASSSAHPMVLLSPSDFFVDLQDIVHSPSEETHFFSSADNVDVTNCSLNIADDETLDLMYFENDYV